MKFLNQFTSVAICLFSLNVFSAGYEKSVLWSGKWTALGGSASAIVDGADATFFNPAGLVYGPDKEISVSLSPTFSQFNAPVFTSNTQEASEQIISPVFGLTYKLGLTDEWALGASLAVAGGSKVAYKDITPGTGLDEVGQMTDLQDLELSFGAGYALDENWSLGFAWRISFINAELQASQPSTSPAGIAEFNFSELSATNLDGFRLGAQFRPNAKWGMGFAYRSAVDFEADGKFQALITPPNPKSTLVATKDLKGVKSTLPDAFSLDYYRQLSEDWKIFFGYTKTMYSKNEKLILGDNGAVPEFPLNWDDQENVRFATEYVGVEDWVMRGAYVYTSQVVPNEYASPTFSTPGAGHTLVIGGGKTFLDKYTFDMSLEYSWAESLDVTNLQGITGDYDASATALHASVKMPL